MTDDSEVMEELLQALDNEIMKKMIPLWE